MSNPNGPNKGPNTTNLENYLDSITPDPRHFEGTIYPADEISKDIDLLDTYKKTPEYQKSGERSDAKLLEKTFINEAEIGDWFGEEELYIDDPEYVGLTSIPTSEIDDTFNHIDLISIINNEVTGHEALPFTIDLTYNTDPDKMAKKFRWRHVHGKSADASTESSEFGEPYTTQDPDGNTIIKTKSLPLKSREGLKIPGFASAKYFEDRSNQWTPLFPKGRIDIMPRFVVGYSSDIAEILARGTPSQEYKEKYGEEAYYKRVKEYRDATKRAKWCTLYECSEQASQMHAMLDNLSPDETKWMDPEELAKAKKQIAIMDEYFQNALKVATQKAQKDENESEAMQYANRDSVRQSISEHSYNTYVAKQW